MKTKYIYIILIGLFLNTFIYGQIDKNSNPIFNSIILNVDTFDNFQLVTNYYTIDNNISNKESSAYINDSPTTDEYVRFARDLPAYYFIVQKDNNVIFMIMPMQKNTPDTTTISYIVINRTGGNNKTIPCSIPGEIFEKRSEELVKLKVDPKAHITQEATCNVLFYDNKKYKILPYKKLKNEIIEIAKGLINPYEDNSKENEEFIRKETIGGKLDFKKILIAKGNGNKLIVANGIAYNTDQFAIYLWGKAVQEVGLKTLKEAQTLWESINKREMTAPESNALKNAFKK
jgi:hypothetical protein